MLRLCRVSSVVCGCGLGIKMLSQLPQFPCVGLCVDLVFGSFLGGIFCGSAVACVCVSAVVVFCSVSFCE